MWAIGHCKNLITRSTKRMSFRISVRQNLFAAISSCASSEHEGPADMKFIATCRQAPTTLSSRGGRRSNFDESVNQFAEHNYNNCV